MAQLIERQGPVMKDLNPQLVTFGTWELAFAMANFLRAWKPVDRQSPVHNPPPGTQGGHLPPGYPQPV
jgi:hypothetical protein